MTRAERRMVKKVLLGLLLYGGSVHLEEALQIDNGDWEDSGVFEGLIEYENAPPARWWITEKGKEWLAQQQEKQS